MFVDGSLNFDTNVNTKNFTKGIEGIKSKLGGVKSAFSKFGTAVATAFSTAAIVGFGKSLIESAAAVNASNSQMEQTFGSFYNSANEAMRRVAETSGIVQTRLQGVGTSIYAFAKTSGMDSASALNMMEEALQVTADSAAYYDRSLEETSQSLQSFLKGNYANDAALGLSCTETTRNIAANKLYGKSFIELSESQKQLTLLQMVKDANALSGALGQASREADGWENVIGNLKEAWKQFMAVVGQPVLNVAVSAVKQLTEALTFLTEKARSVLGVLSELFGWETDDSEEVSVNISESVSEQNELTEAVEETAETQKKSLAGFDEINTLSEKTEKSAETSENKSEEIAVKPAVVNDERKTKKEIDNFSHKIAEFIKPIKLAWEANSPELIKNVKTAFENIKELAKSVAESFEEVWTNGSGERYIGNIITLFSDVFGIIGDIAGALKSAWDDNGRGTDLIQSYFDRWNALFELIHAVNSAFREAWNDGTGEKICENIFEIIININNTVSNLRQRFTEAWNENGTGVRIFGAILGIINIILGIINRLTKSTSEWAKKLDFSPFLESVADFFESLEPLVKNVGDIFSGIYEKILLPLGKWTIEKVAPASIDLFSGAFAFLTSPITLVCLAIGAVIAIGVLLVKHWDEVKAFAVGVWESIQETLYSFFEAWEIGWNAIVDFMSEVWSSITGFFAKSWENIVSIFQNIGGWFSDRWNDITSALSEVANWFSEKFRQARENITEIFRNIGNWFSDRWYDIVNIFSVVGDWFRNTFSSAWEAVRNVFSKGGEIFTGITNGIFDTFKNIVNGLIDGINWVIAQPFNTINWALDGIRYIEILGWYPFWGLPSINVPRIPYLAQGTVVPANYGNFLAVLGDNKRETEVVSPLSTIEQAVTNAMKKNSVGNSEIHIHVDLDGREIGRVAVKAVNQDRLRRGG